MATLDRIEAALLGDEERVEMVLRAADGGFTAATADGRATYRATPDGWTVSDTEGTPPLADGAADRFLGTADEQAQLQPHRSVNAYPDAPERVAHVFAHSSAPDLAVVRTAAFHVHGNLGEHGSIGAVQSRASFLAGGKGIRTQGVIDHHIANVDVAPTIAALLGVHPHEDGSLLAGQDGTVRHELLDGEQADVVVAMLFDGLNPNLLHDAIESGEVPHLAALLDDGVSLRKGSLASFPTVTLPNHTTLLTGRHPGNHGVLSNSWHDRSSGETPNLLDFQQMAIACDHLVDGVETLHEAVHRSDPSAFTGSTYEYADRGADWSTFDVVRDGGRPNGVPRRGEPIPHADDRFLDADEYHFQSRIDTASLRQALAMLDPAQAPDGAAFPDPRFVWINFSLTDTAGHSAGPHGDMARAALVDSDARLGEVLAALDRTGRRKSAAVVVLSDHGMELTDPAVDGHYRETLAAAGLVDGEDYLDVDDGLIYVLS